MRVKVMAFFTWIIVIYAISIVLWTLFGNYLLKKNGNCTNAILINEQIDAQASKPTLVYEFVINGKNYKRNSLVDDLSKVGDSVCIIYLVGCPSINRPLKYFELGEITCSCKE